MFFFIDFQKQSLLLQRGLTTKPHHLKAGQGCPSVREGGARKPFSGRNHHQFDGPQSGQWYSRRVGFVAPRVIVRRD
jgi:hypothetical protein